MAIVTVSRQLGSGEFEFSTQLAERLGYRLIDRQLLERAAEELDVPIQAIEAIDEQPSPPLEVRIARRILSGATERVPLLWEEIAKPELSAGAVRSFLPVVIHELAAQDNLLFVGRGAGFVLAERPDVCRFHLIAPIADRVLRVRRLFNVEAAEARRVIDRTDRARGRFIRETFGADWSNPLNYDVVFNTGVLGIAAAVEAAAAAVHRRIRMLAA
ncbi:MAG: cytidylate kinase-like family protein [Actinobacteria bacterium]|nr:cytidylate kinase-like family protein [Actinomycetota bacterium]